LPQVELKVDKDSKEAKRAAEKQKAAAAEGGLDAFLQQIESKKKARGLMRACNGGSSSSSTCCSVIGADAWTRVVRGV
jgi:hypothetical protein